jgi:hypothetical protein
MREKARRGEEYVNLCISAQQIGHMLNRSFIFTLIIEQYDNVQPEDGVYT